MKSKQLIFIVLLILLQACSERNDILDINAYNDLIEGRYKNLYEIININELKFDSIEAKEDIRKIEEIRSDFKQYREIFRTGSNLTENELAKIKDRLTSIGVSEKERLSYISLLENNHKNNINVSIMNLYLLESLIISYKEDFLNGNYFIAKWFCPIVVPEKNPIKLGEEYKCKLYLSVVNGVPFKGKINDQILTNDDFDPVFKIKPTSKGKKEYDGELGFKINHLYKDTVFLPFKILFEVK